MLEYQYIVLQHSMMRAGQKLHIGKCEILYAADEVGRPRPRPWSARELRDYQQIGVYTGCGQNSMIDLARMVCSAQAPARPRRSGSHGEGEPQTDRTDIARMACSLPAPAIPHAPAGPRMASSQAGALEVAHMAGAQERRGESEGPLGKAAVRMASLQVLPDTVAHMAFGGETVDPHGVAEARMAIRTEDRMVAVADTVVLGTVLTNKRSQGKAVPARMRAAWQTWTTVRVQMACQHVPVRAPVQLMDAIILPTLMWGLESLVLTNVEGRRLDALQRTMVGRVLRLPQRPRETADSFFRRRERCISATVRKMCRAKWSQLQRYRHFCFLGHVARLDPDTHLASLVLHWRSDRWWESYRDTLPAKTGGQEGRRAACMSTPGAAERAVREAFDRVCRQAPHLRHAAVAVLEAWPVDWRLLAQDRKAWREFSRWACFPDALTHE